jgi:protein-tyrosine phosphatase
MTVERHGVYDERFVRKLMRWTILFVCSGNTCRSPMAAGLARTLLAKERSIGEDDLPNAGLQVISAGVSATTGDMAAPEAAAVVRELGGDLGTHRSRLLDKDLVQEADVIYCMTRKHQQAVLALAPDAAGRTFLLDPTGDIPDPIGQNITVYRHTAEQILENLWDRLKEES